MYGILLRQLFFLAAIVYSGSWDFLYGQCKQLFVSEINNAPVGSRAPGQGVKGAKPP